MGNMMARPAPATDHMTDYDRNSTVQDRLIRLRADRLRALVQQIGPLDRPFTLADYGCGPGHSALDAVTPAIEAYRALSPDGPIVVRHCDQPGNDSSALLRLVFGPEGYQSEDGGIRTEASVGSFYDVLAAPASIDLATSFAASHWLSRAIHPYSPGTVSFDSVEGEARAELAALARADWTRFLRCRAAELAPGGYLLVGTLGAVRDPEAKNGVRVTGRKFIRVFETVAASMVSDGLLDGDALDHFVLPYWFLTREEAVAPVEEEPDLAAAFAVVQASVEPVPAQRNEIYSGEFDDPVDYGRRCAGYVRGFAESSMRLHLFHTSVADEAEMDARIAEFFRRYAAAIPEAPGTPELLDATFVMRRL